MRLRRLTLKGITRFQEPVTVDFEALGEGLIAIAGRNGEGKTTLMEAPYAALHLEMPTRPGGLYGVAHGKDARIELEVTNGQPYRCVVAVDALRQTSEAYLFNGTGQPVNPSGKLREYGAAIAERFGSPRLMLSAALSCQTKRGSFLDLSKAERKDLLAEILDTAGLQRLAEGARACSKTAELDLARVRGQIAEASAELQRLSDTFEAGIDPAVLEAHAQGLAAKVPILEAQLEETRRQYATLQTRLALAQQAATRRRQLSSEAEHLDRQQGAIRSKVRGLADEEVGVRSKAMADALEAEQTAKRLPEYLQAARDLEEAQQRVTECQTLVIDGRAAVETARQEVERLRREQARAEQIGRELAAAQRQAELLGLVPCTANVTWIEDNPDRVPVLAYDLAGTCPLLANARTASATAQQLADQAQALVNVPGQLAEAGNQSDQVRVLLALAEEAHAKQQTEIARLTPLAARVDVARAASQHQAEIATRLEADLTAIATRRREYQEQAHGLEARAAAVLAELQVPQDDPAEVSRDMQTEGEAGRRLRDELETTRAELQQAQRTIDRARLDAERRAELTGRLDVARATEAMTVADLGEWGTLERAFGRDGIQALLIDAAGPELSELTNELLRSCFSERFEVRFATQAAKKSGDGMREVFDVVVIDHERGREGSVDSLSGGEKTIIGEAISLALAVYVGRNSGRTFGTLFRDEVAGQLDPENAQRYLQMLRKARLIGGFHQVILIAQQTEVWQGADAVLWVEGGRVEVRNA